MRNHRMKLAQGGIVCLLAGAAALLCTHSLPAQTPQGEQAIWNIEHAYWQYVESKDLTAYRSLWDENFLGWPSVSSAPVGKEHITDWITSQAKNGRVFKSIEFKPAAIRLTGDIAVTCYWITFKWVDRDGNGDPATLRVTHTWDKKGKNWKIIGGMSMAEPTPLQK